MVQPVSELGAFPGEPGGFEGVPWGSSAVQVFQARPGLKRRGYRRYAVAAAARQQKDGLFMDEVGPLLGFDEAEIRYLVGPRGLFQVEVSLQDMGAGASLAGKQVIETLVGRYGPASTDPESRLVWAGETTVVSLEEKLSMSGSHVELVYTLRRRWTPVALTAPLQAAAETAAAPGPAPPAEADSAPAPKPVPEAKAQQPQAKTKPKKPAVKNPPAKKGSDDLFDGADPADLISGDRP